MKTSTKQNKTYQPPKTIKVRTILLIIVWLATVFAGVAAGWALRSADNVRVYQEAENLLKLNTKSE